MSLHYPVAWPAGWPRARHRSTAAFGKKVGWEKKQLTFADAIERLQHELDLLGASSVKLSTNIELRLDGRPRLDRGAPGDPAVALHFVLKGRDTALACDKWDRVADNITALAKHIEALRGIDRWGVGSVSQAFAGYQALPAPEQWWQVLELPGENVTRADISIAYRRLAATAHPDNKATGSDAAMARLNAARDQAMAARGGV